MYEESSPEENDLIDPGEPEDTLVAGAFSDSEDDVETIEDHVNSTRETLTVGVGYEQNEAENEEDIIEEEPTNVGVEVIHRPRIFRGSFETPTSEAEAALLQSDGEADYSVPIDRDISDKNNLPEDEGEDEIGNPSELYKEDPVEEYDLDDPSDPEDMTVDGSNFGSEVNVESQESTERKSKYELDDQLDDYWGDDKIDDDDDIVLDEDDELDDYYQNIEFGLDEFDPDAHIDLFNGIDDLSKATIKADDKAGEIYKILRLPQKNKNKKALKWLSSFFENYPHWPTFLAIIRMIEIEDVSFVELQEIVNVKDYWRERPVFWQVRTWNNKAKIYQFFRPKNGEFSLTWKAAKKLNDLRGDFPIDEIIPDDWLMEWKNFGHEERLPWTFVEYLSDKLDNVSHEKLTEKLNWEQGYGDFNYENFKGDTMSIDGKNLDNPIHINLLSDFLTTNFRRDTRTK